MLHFPDEYFKTEVREGFAVYELMKRTWAAQLEVLAKIIAIFDKYHLTYYAYWGTLLGAVRHQGYIPWDDDLDIAMKRDDYIKFLEVTRQELPEEYCILNYYTETEYDNVFTRITNAHGLDLSDDRMTQYHGCPFVVGVDIFPLYYVPGNSQEAEFQKAILHTIDELLKLLGQADAEKQMTNNMALAEGLVELEKITGYRFTTDRPIHNQLKILYDQVSRLYDEQDSNELTVFPLYMTEGYAVNKDLFAECTQMPFENIMINVPKGYDEILSKSYDDYMVPKQLRATHDYPFYKGQLKIWGRYLYKDDCLRKEQQRKNSTDSFENVIDEKTGMPLPKEWAEKIHFESGVDRKKVILYHTSFEALMCQGAFVLDKLRYVFETFRQNPNVVIWWVPCVLANPNLSYFQKMVPQLLLDYQQMIEEFQRDNIGIYDDTGDVQRAVAMADAYFGDEGEVLELFKETKGLIMIQDYEIMD